MASSAIYTVSTNSSVPAGGTIPLGTVIRRYGRSVKLEGDSVTCCGCGYYDASVTATVTPTATGTVGIQLMQDGSPVPGAVVREAGTADMPMGLALRALVRQASQCGATSLSLALTSDGSATVDNCPLVVEKT